MRCPALSIWMSVGTPFARFNNMSLRADKGTASAAPTKRRCAGSDQTPGGRLAVTRESRIMRFAETGLEGLWLIEPDYFRDERGSFARTYCEREFAAVGLTPHFVQHSQSLSRRRNTRRGLRRMIMCRCCVIMYRGSAMHIWPRPDRRSVSVKAAIPRPGTS